MRNLVIGSVAMQRHGLTNRIPNDYDVFSDDPHIGEDSFWSPEFSEWIPEGTDRYATIDELLTIKLSHAGWELPNRSWDKHMNDVLVLQDAGAEVIEDLYALLYRVWERRHGRKVVDLTQEADEFFSDAVRRKYDHDSLHESVAYGDRPLYESVLKPGKSVQMDMARIWAMPHDWVVRLFREEIYVTALERKVIPSDYTTSPRAAYHWALRRTVTSLTKGKSSRFIAENFREFRSPDMDYVSHHLSRADRLKPFGG